MRAALFLFAFLSGISAFAQATPPFAPPFTFIMEKEQEKGLIPIEEASVKNIDPEEIKSLLASLNAAGGIPFSTEKGKYTRVKLTAAQLEGKGGLIPGLLNNVIYPVIIDLEENGSRYLLFSTQTSPVTGAASIWRKTGKTWTRVFISAGQPIGIKKSGDTVEFVFSDINTYARAAYSIKKRTFTALGLVDRAPGGADSIVTAPDDAAACAPVAMDAQAGRQPLNLYAKPDPTSYMLGTVQRGGAITKIASYGDWMLVLTRQPLRGEWYSTYAGKGWRLGWMKGR